MKPVAILTVLVGLSPMGWGAAETMLCVHRDGRAVVEPYQDLCCKPAAEPCCDGPCSREKTSRGCPDDQCRDFPLSVESEQGAPGPAEAVVPPDPVPSPPAGAEPSFGVSLVPPALPSYARCLGPPSERSPDLLRTIVLLL